MPVTVSGVTVNRFCSSGLQTIAMAAQRIIAGEADCIVAGGLESISLTQEGGRSRAGDRGVAAQPQAGSLDADDRDRRHRGGALQRVARGAGRVFAGKPAPHRVGPAGRALQGRDRAAADDARRWSTRTPRRSRIEEVTLKSDEGNRPDTNLEGLAALKPVREGGFITAGNASQLSDGASRLRGDERQARREEGPEAARHVPRLRGRGLRAGRDGHRPGVRGAEAAAAHRHDDGRHRPVGAERGVRQPGAVLPRPARHSAGQAQRRTAARSRSAIRSA